MGPLAGARAVAPPHRDLVHRDSYGDGGDGDSQGGDLSSQAGHFSSDVDGFLRRQFLCLFPSRSNRAHLDLFLSSQFHFLVSFIQEMKLIVEGDCLLFMGFLRIPLNINKCKHSVGRTLFEGFLSINLNLFSSLFFLCVSTTSFSLLSASQTFRQNVNIISHWPASLTSDRSLVLSSSSAIPLASLLSF